MAITVQTPNVHNNQYIGLIEESETHIRIPVASRMSSDIIRTIVISPERGISALYSTNRKVILTYIFDKRKENWTIDSAKSWVEKHIS